MAVVIACLRPVPVTIHVPAFLPEPTQVEYWWSAIGDQVAAIFILQYPALDRDELCNEADFIGNVPVPAHTQSFLPGGKLIQLGIDMAHRQHQPAPAPQGIAEKLEQNNIRVEIDERDLSLAKKIRAAEKLWTPLIFVIGEKEVKQEGSGHGFDHSDFEVQIFKKYSNIFGMEPTTDKLITIASIVREAIGMPHKDPSKSVNKALQKICENR